MQARTREDGGQSERTMAVQVCVHDSATTTPPTAIANPATRSKVLLGMHGGCHSMRGTARRGTASHPAMVHMEQGETKRPGRGNARLAIATMVLNSVVLGALTVLTFDPQRRAFGRMTGLWHPCLPSGGATGYERWSPMLLFLLVPVALGSASSAWLAKPGSTRLRWVSVALGVFVLALVVVPTASCIA
jgi:hypothetical protein